MEHKFAKWEQLYLKDLSLPSSADIVTTLSTKQPKRRGLITKERSIFFFK
jgi:hypothetical protein